MRINPACKMDWRDNKKRQYFHGNVSLFVHLLILSLLLQTICSTETYMYLYNIFKV